MRKTPYLDIPPRLVIDDPYRPSGTCRRVVLREHLAPDLMEVRDPFDAPPCGSRFAGGNRRGRAVIGQYPIEDLHLGSQVCGPLIRRIVKRFLAQTVASARLHSRDGFGEVAGGG